MAVGHEKSEKSTCLVEPLPSQIFFSFCGRLKYPPSRSAFKNVRHTLFDHQVSRRSNKFDWLLAPSKKGPAELLPKNGLHQVFGRWFPFKSRFTWMSREGSLDQWGILMTHWSCRSPNRLCLDVGGKQLESVSKFQSTGSTHMDASTPLKNSKKISITYQNHRGGPGIWMSKIRIFSYIFSWISRLGTWSTIRYIYLDPPGKVPWYRFALLTIDITNQPSKTRPNTLAHRFILFPGPIYSKLQVKIPNFLSNSYQLGKPERRWLTCIIHIHILNSK